MWSICSNKLLNNHWDKHEITLEIIYIRLQRKVYQHYDDFNNSKTTLQYVEEWIEENFYND